MASTRVLRHEFEYDFTLNAEAGGYDAVHLPFITHDQGKTNPEDVYTNYLNDSYAGIQAHPCTYGNSSVDKIFVEVVGNLDKDNDSACEFLRTKNVLVHGAFDDWETTCEEDSDASLLSYLGLKLEDTNENQVHPNYNGNKVEDFNTLDSAYVGLTTNQQMEHITFDAEKYDARYGHSSVSGMLHKISSGVRDVIVKKEMPIFESRWMDVPSNTIAQNRKTHLGMIIKLPQLGDSDQYYLATDFTSTKVHYHVKVKYNEKNPLFDPSA